MTAYHRSVLLMIVFMAFVLAVFYVLLKNTGVEAPLDDRYEITVGLPSAANLAVNGDVRTGGVSVGRVDQVRVTGTTAVAKISLDEDSAEVYDNAKVQLRYKSALNEGYLDLDAGGGPGARLIPDDGHLPLSRVQETVQIDQVLSTLDPSTRARFQRLLDGLGGGLRDRGDELNSLLRASSDLVDRGDRTLEVLAAERRLVGHLIDDFGQVAAALGARRSALQLLARRARTASEAVAARGEQLTALVAELPRTLDQARATTGRLGDFADTATPVVADLDRTMVALGPAIRRLPAAARAGRTVARELDAFNRPAENLFGALAPFGRAAASAMPGLDGFLRQLNPLTAYLSSQRSNLTAFFSNYTAATDTTDATGHVNKLTFLFNRNALVSAVDENGRRAIEALEDAGILSALTGKIGHNPYPADGQIGGNPQPFTGEYPRLRAQPRKLKGAP